MNPFLFMPRAAWAGSTFTLEDNAKLEWIVAAKHSSLFREGLNGKLRWKCVLWNWTLMHLISWMNLKALSPFLPSHSLSLPFCQHSLIIIIILFEKKNHPNVTCICRHHTQHQWFCFKDIFSKDICSKHNYLMLIFSNDISSINICSKGICKLVFFLHLFHPCLFKRHLF